MDWERIHERVRVARAALERGLSPTPAEKQRILRDRARLLAREPATEERPAQMLEVVAFRLCYEQYGIESRYVREVHPLKDLRPIPGTPAYVLGLISVRGRILCIMDLRKFFDLPERGLTDLNKVLILQAGPMEVGILADAVLGITRIAGADLQRGLATLTGIRAEYVKAVTRDAMVVLEIDRFLSDDRILVDEG